MAIEFTAQELTQNLDINGLFPLHIRLEPRGKKIQIHAELDASNISNLQFKANLAALLQLDVGIEPQHLYFKTNENGLVYCDAEIRAADLKQGLQITLNHEPLAKLVHHNGQGMLPVPANSEYGLTVSEVRMLSFPMTQTQLSKLPHDRTQYATRLHEYRLPITDLHTHLSSQLPAKELLEVAAIHDLAYPIELLDLIQQGERQDTRIDYSGMARKAAKPCKFDPAVNKRYALECEMSDSAEGLDASKLQGVSIRELCGLDEKGEPLAKRTPMQQRAYQKLQQAMAIPADQIFGPNDFDNYFYRYRNPLEKHPALAHDKIMRVAKHYKEQGIEYAELSTGSMFNPDWLAEAIPSLEEAEATYGVKMRLLVGIARSSSPESVAKQIEKLKFIAQCPYIVGVDFLGFESNRTEDFNWALYNIARWTSRLGHGIQDYEPAGHYTDQGFVIRVHAGENAENRRNVGEAIDVAKRLGVRMRIGHAVYAHLDEELMTKARDAGVMIEFIPDSNIALNNIVYPSDIPMKKWAERKIPFVLGSDGAGAYQTDNRQLAISAIHAGLTVKDLDALNEREREYVYHPVTGRQKYFEDKRDAFFNRFGIEGEIGRDGSMGWKKFVDSYRVHAKEIDGINAYERVSIPPQRKVEGAPILPARFNCKLPILVAGASGSSWQDIKPEDQKQIDLAMRMFVEMLDPAQVYFVTGRVKDRGLEKMLDEAIIARHERKMEDPNERSFDVIATNTLDSNDNKLAYGVTWVNSVKCKPEEVAPHVIDFMTSQSEQCERTREQGEMFGSTKGGYALFAGGKFLTSEFIRLARKAGLPHGLMVGPEGAADKQAARAYEHELIQAEKNVPLAEATLRHVLDNLEPIIFRPEYRQEMIKGEAAAEKAIHKAYETVRARQATSSISTGNDTLHAGIVGTGAERVNGPQL